jgi:hypothetical protein
MAKKKAAKRGKAPAPIKRLRTGTLPGLEDRAIAAIENAAYDYAERRDSRMAATLEETKYHGKLLDVMRKHGKKTYKHSTGEEIIEVNVTVKDPEEKAKVRIREVGDEDAGTPAAASADDAAGDELPIE